MGQPNDPLHLLPSEVVLRILHFTPIDSLARLTRLNISWHKFIDEIHQDAIYTSKTEHPPGCRHVSFLKDSQSFSLYYSSVTSWKELCKRQILLDRKWKHPQPITRESTIQVGDDPIWRFKPDFKRRIILSTSQAGGLNVTDMDDGRLLWSLDRELVRDFAHLEYQDGTAVWDREENALEVWRTEHEDGMVRGEFRNVAVLQHDCATRGFQLSFDTLCVVSSEGKGFVYRDVATGMPRLDTEMEIESGAVGHLDQGPDAVAWSIGGKGYHFHDKSSGQLLGFLQPKMGKKLYHVEHQTASGRPDFRSESGMRNLTGPFPPLNPRNDRTCGLIIHEGPMPLPDGEFLSLDEDEWGAGILNGDMFAGYSRGGRLFVCSNWRRALQGEKMFAAETSIIECDSDGSTFDSGGWLSAHDHKVMFEIQDRIHIIGLNDEDRIVPSHCNPPRPSMTISTCLTSQLAVPVSFMSIYDDCVMTTYTTLRYRSRQGNGVERPSMSALPTKVIRILSLAPNLIDSNESDEEVVARQKTTELAEPVVAWHREDMYSLIEMLVGDGSDEDADVEAALDLMEGQAGGGDLDDID